LNLFDLRKQLEGIEKEIASTTELLSKLPAPVSSAIVDDPVFFERTKHANDRIVEQMIRLKRAMATFNEVFDRDILPWTKRPSPKVRTATHKIRILFLSFTKKNSIELLSSLRS
jgi:hypothetical protein